MSFPLELPDEVWRVVRGARWTQVAIGCSRAEVYRFDTGLYLKTVLRNAADAVFGNLEGEAQRLEALKGLVPVPVVELFVQDDARDFLLMAEVVGEHAAGKLREGEVHDTVAAVAAGCRLFHAAAARGFPVVEDVGTLLAQARDRVDRGLVDTADFDRERAGRSAEDLFEELCRLAPGPCQPVLTHGDLSLTNLIVQGNATVGFIDVGRAAVSDPWRDLALCVRSIEDSCGEKWSDEYLRLYGVERNEGKLHFYTLLDEFF